MKSGYMPLQFSALVQDTRGHKRCQMILHISLKPGESTVLIPGHLNGMTTNKSPFSILGSRSAVLQK